MATPQPDRAMWDRILADIPPEDLLRAGIRRDELTGAPYSIGPNGQRNYISPAAWRRVRAEDMPADGSVPADPNVPADTTGIFRKGPQWNTKTGRWDTPLDWSNILNVAVGSGLGAAGLSAAGAFGGGAAGAASPAAAFPEAVPLTSEFMAGAMPGSMASVNAAGVGLGGAGMGAPGASGLGRVAGSAAQAAGSKGVGDIVKRLAQAGLPIGALLGTRALTGGGGDGPGPSAISPELQQLLAMSMRRMAAQEPLFEAVNRQALGGLPEYAKGGR